MIKISDPNLENLPDMTSLSGDRCGCGVEQVVLNMCRAFTFWLCQSMSLHIEL